jgi:protein-ribulosamine 3-kinase
MATLPASLLAALQQVHGLQVDHARPLGGGCIHQATRLSTPGGDFFLKYNQPQEAHNFAVEAQGLSLLRETSTARIPAVIGRGETKSHAYLLLEYIEPGRPGPRYWEQLGEQLARLHQHSRPQFGLDYDNYIGRLPQANPDLADWPTFFAEARIRPLLRQAIDRGLMDRQDLQDFERLVPILDEIFPEEPPALIHGDLWGGNLLTDARGEAVLIDPAVHYAHREMELAFMTLFDRQPPAFHAAYEGVYPLAPGWRDRIDLCNLYPLLVHVNLFGGGYASSARQALRRYL